MLQATAFRSKQQTKEQRSTVKNKIAELLITYQLISALKTNPRLFVSSAFGISNRMRSS
jgi:hypothetical protein